VAVRAAYFTSSDFLKDSPPRHAAPAQSADLSVLSAYVVELQDNRVGLTAVDAWMGFEVLPLQLRKPRL
jgi:hypothetical protein